MQKWSFMPLHAASEFSTKKMVQSFDPRWSILVFSLIFWTSSFLRRYFGVFVMAQSCFALLLSVLLVSGLAAWSYLEEAGRGTVEHDTFWEDCLIRKNERIHGFYDGFYEIMKIWWENMRKLWHSTTQSRFEHMKRPLRWVYNGSQRSFCRIFGVSSRPPVWVCKLLGMSLASLSGPETWSCLKLCRIWISQRSYNVHIMFI